tara:strand:+ start:275 stop:496 length:222 start_codon:yes stop_codon:yes gene_type:complete
MTRTTQDKIVTILSMLGSVVIFFCLPLIPIAALALAWMMGNVFTTPILFIPYIMLVIYHFVLYDASTDAYKRR